MKKDEILHWRKVNGTEWYRWWHLYWWSRDYGCWIAPRWWVYLFGGHYRQMIAGIGYNPSLLRLVFRFYAEGWPGRGWSLREWLRLA